MTDTPTDAPTATPEPPGTPADASAPLLDRGYRPHLDGLRTIAVFLVVAFHAGLAHAAGGFIGVDVFFVLSGFLVTQLLVRDIGGQGSIRLSRFYARRIRRLLPAAALTLLVTAVVYSYVGSTSQVLESAGAFKASFLYSANWWFVRNSTSYFATNTARNPVLHFWSLAVEEQFYLVWPLLLGGLAALAGRFGPRRWNVVRTAITVGAVASAGWALALRHAHTDRAYFGTDARAYQLLAGALLALSPGLVRRAARSQLATRIGVVAGLGAIVLLATDGWKIDAIERGIAVTLATAVLIIALEANAGGSIKGALGIAPLTYLGRISYGIYLWHWPVIIVLTEELDPTPLALAAEAAVLATACAALSYHLLEMPIRSSRWLDGWRGPVIAVGLALSLLFGLVVVPQLTKPRSIQRSTPSTATAGSTPVPASIDTGKIYFEKFGKGVDCVGKPLSTCTIVRGNGKHVLLMGDSNAEMWVPALKEVAERENLTLSLAVTEGCLWQRDVYKLSPEIIARCRKAKADAYDRIAPGLKPDLIIVSNAQELKGPPTATFADDPFNRRLREKTPESLAYLQSLAKQVLIIEPIPQPADKRNPLDCLGKARFVEECAFQAPEVTTWVEQQERSIAARSGGKVVSADFDRLACPAYPRCDEVVDGTVVFWNEAHLTTRYVRTLADPIARYLKANDLIPT